MLNGTLPRSLSVYCFFFTCPFPLGLLALTFRLREIVRHKPPSLANKKGGNAFSIEDMTVSRWKDCTSSWRITFQASAWIMQLSGAPTWAQAFKAQSGPISFVAALSRLIPPGLKWETSCAENTWVCPDWAKVGSAIRVCNGLYPWGNDHRAQDVDEQRLAEQLKWPYRC